MTIGSSNSSSDFFQFSTSRQEKRCSIVYLQRKGRSGTGKSVHGWILFERGDEDICEEEIRPMRACVCVLVLDRPKLKIMNLESEKTQTTVGDGFEFTRVVGWLFNSSSPVINK